MASVVVIVYAGLVLADKAAITFWRSWLIPAQFVLSSLAMSAATIMVMETLNSAWIDTLQCWLLEKFLMLLLVTIGWHLLTDRGKPGKAEALERLRTRYRWLFFGGVIGAGTLLPALLADVAHRVAHGSAGDRRGLLRPHGRGRLLSAAAHAARRLLSARDRCPPPVQARVTWAAAHQSSWTMSPM